MKIRILSRKEILDFIEVGKEGTYIWIGLGFSLYSIKKQKSQKEEGGGGQISEKQENK